MKNSNLDHSFIHIKIIFLFLIISIALYKFYETKIEKGNLKAESSVESLSNVSSSFDGWSELGKSPYVKEGKCTLDRIHVQALSRREFLAEYAFTKPFVLTGLSNYNEKFKKMTTRNNLIKKYGSTQVKLSSANSYSYDRQYIRFDEYCSQYLSPQKLSALATETYYFFGDNGNMEWMPLMEHYDLPLLSIPGYLPQLSFGIAGSGSGVPFHFHGPGFAETMWGRKRWFLYPPNEILDFDPTETTLNWFLKKYSSMENDPLFLECTLQPGEMIYFPGKWWHATLNVDATVFMSTFLSP